MFKRLPFPAAFFLSGRLPKNIIFLINFVPIIKTMKPKLPNSHLMNKFFNVLLADDDLDDQEFFIDALRGLKIGALEAHRHINLTRVYDGQQALDFLLKQGHWKGTKARLPDFVVLDLNMPVLDGFYVLEQIQLHKEFKNIPVYILTTLKDEGSKKKCTSLGCAGFFSKPMQLEELREVIGDILKKLI